MEEGKGFVKTPWGGWETLIEGPRYKVKRIIVNPGHRLSLQLHHHRSEHWVVVSGKAKVICGGEEGTFDTGEHIFIPKETPHRLGNEGSEPLIVIEVQYGDYLGEDDIVRIEDDYGRT